MGIFNSEKDCRYIETEANPLKAHSRAWMDKIEAQHVIFDVWEAVF